MNKKLLAGTIAGLSTLALAIPAFAQVTDTGTSSAPSFMGMRHSFTQEDIQQMIARDDAFLANIDAMIVVQKSATQSHRAALTAAAAITDDAARQEAVKQAHEDMRAAIEAAVTANPDLKGNMMAFGKGRGHGSGHMRGRRMMKGMQAPTDQ